MTTTTDAEQASSSCSTTTRHRHNVEQDRIQSDESASSWFPNHANAPSASSILDTRTLYSPLPSSRNSLFMSPHAYFTQRTPSGENRRNVNMRTKQEMCDIIDSVLSIVDPDDDFGSF
mmetsp:Transcript_135415/g.201378  ORF Transcript_135415/g.201378 Transcript_135415/m.201378 type:complete len:118 (-) Transcript_135415:189-542(-)